MKNIEYYTIGVAAFWIAFSICGHFIVKHSKNKRIRFLIGILHFMNLFLLFQGFCLDFQFCFKNNNTYLELKNLNLLNNNTDDDMNLMEYRPSGL